MEYRRICGWGEEASALYYEPLAPEMFNLFEDAEVAAYKEVVFWQQSPKVGGQIHAKVYRPFCCAEGDTFWSVDKAGQKEERFVQAKLLAILSYGESYGADCATICVEVLQIIDVLSFMKPVPEITKKQLMEERSYNYDPPEGDYEYPDVFVENNWITISNRTSGAEVAKYHCIYTDADGIDHLITAGESYCESSLGEYVLAGDRVLGYHADNPHH